MFTPDPSVSFAETHRVLALDGRVGVLTWAGIEHNPWMTCVGMAAMMNGLMAGGPPTGPGGAFSLADPPLLESLAGAAGFVGIQTDTVDLTFRSDNIDHHVARVSSMAGPLAVVLQGASAEQQAAVLQAATELTAQYVTDTGLDIPGRALLTSAHRS